MASTKMKALISIVRFLIAIAIGVGIWYMFDQTRWQPELSIGSGILAAVVVFLLLSKLSASGGSD